MSRVKAIFANPLSLLHALFVTVLCGLVASCASSTPRPPADLPYTQLNDSSFSELLSEYVVDGYVSYAGFRDSRDFPQYVEQIADLDSTTLKTDQERLAFYINAYNALAIQGILDGYSTRNYWTKAWFFVLTDYWVTGQEINLWDLEHVIIRSMGEPRIHFALVCAAKSCPKLRSEAYTPDQLDRQLDDQARGFFNDPHKNSFDKVNKIAYLSPIMDWFTEDFESTGKTLQEYVAGYIDDPEIRADLAANNYQLQFKKYDWSLNGDR